MKKRIHKSQYAIAIFLVLLVSVQSCSTNSVKFQQYYAQGQLLYEKHCSNCHQKNGQGLRRVYPPLAGSDFLKNNFESSVCLIKYGISKEITVNGTTFNKPMPGVLSLTELELAELVTYITNSWGAQREIPSIEDITRSLKKCALP